ncbi:MAG TPA: hypothetical protein VFS42_12235 [Burkholderiaceae bacterium]|nr:hypothetical protein [Burkholderiaceae bacterium]
MNTSPVLSFKTLIALAVGAAFQISTSVAHAIGLGQAELKSGLGQPLRLAVPVRLSDGETLTSTCVSVLPHTGGDGVPPLMGARTAVERGADGTTVVVTTRQAQYEPIIRVALQVGCQDVVTREFVFLLDPPVVPTLTVASGSAEERASNTPRAARATTNESAPTVIGGVPADVDSLAAKPQAPAPVARAPRPAKPRPAAIAPVAKAPIAKAPVVVPAPATTENAAPSATTQTTPVREAGDRMKVVEPGSGSTAFRMDAKLGPPAELTPDTAAVLKDEQARVRAMLLDQEASATAREAQLTEQLTNLGAEIQVLKQQLATETARAQGADKHALPSWWVYVIASLAAALAMAVSYLVVQRRRMKRILASAPWWVDTKLRADVAGGEVVHTDAHDATHREPSLPTANTPTTAASTKPAGTAPSRSSLAGLEVQFPDRLQDSTIEVEELGATQALHLLRAREQRRTIPDVSQVVAAPAETPAPAPVIAQPQLSQVDFDLGAQPLTVAPQEVEIPAVPAASAKENKSFIADMPFMSLDLDLENPAPESTVAPAPSAPSWLSGLETGMSWTEAKQAQAWLREVADAIEQAEAYLSAGQFETAASVLRKLIESRDAVPVAPWLLLLSIYRRGEQRDAYDLLASKFHERYGRAAPMWSHSALPLAEPGLDSEPDLLQAIWAKWGSPDSMALLARLLYDTTTADERFLNFALQRDLLNFVKICPLES